jgi:predicted GNAT family N-acyltransferase
MQFVEIKVGSALYRAELRLREEELRVPLGLSFGAADLDAERGHLHFGLVAEGGALSACVVAVTCEGGAFRLRQMVVAPAWRGQGWGRRLLEEAERALWERGAVRLVLHARLPAVAFYRRMGFRETGDVFMEVTISHQCMVKDLRQGAGV